MSDNKKEILQEIEEEIEEEIDQAIKNVIQSLSFAVDEILGKNTEYLSYFIIGYSEDENFVIVEEILSQEEDCYKVLIPTNIAESNSNAIYYSKLKELIQCVKHLIPILSKEEGNV